MRYVLRPISYYLKRMILKREKIGLHGRLEALLSHRLRLKNWKNVILNPWIDIARNSPNCIKRLGIEFSRNQGQGNEITAKPVELGVQIYKHTRNYLDR